MRSTLRKQIAVLVLQGKSVFLVRPASCLHRRTLLRCGVHALGPARREVLFCRKDRVHLHAAASDHAARLGLTNLPALLRCHAGNNEVLRGLAPILSLLFENALVFLSPTFSLSLDLRSGLDAAFLDGLLILGLPLSGERPCLIEHELLSPRYGATRVGVARHALKPGHYLEGR